MSTPAERPTSQPPVTVDLPAGMTEPLVLRLVAAEVRDGPLGLGGKPRSLPGTLDALADAIEAAQVKEDDEPTPDDSKEHSMSTDSRADAYRTATTLYAEVVAKVGRPEDADPAFEVERIANWLLEGEGETGAYDEGRVMRIESGALTIDAAGRSFIEGEATGR